MQKKGHQLLEVLIVDDDPFCRRVYRAELERGGYIVHEAFDGYDALEKLKELSVDLITLDLVMPKMGGFEFCDRLWSRDFASHFHKNTDRRLPILIITASDSIPNRVKSLRGGIADFLTKGFAPGTLLKRVNQILKPANPFAGLRPFILSSEKETHTILGEQLKELGLECSPLPQKFSPSFLLSDQGLPLNIDVVFIDASHCQEGPQVCHQLREMLAREELPIIVMLPQGPTENFLSWFTAGATDFLLVPFSHGELKAKLGTALAMVRSSEFPVSPDAQPLPAPPSIKEQRRETQEEQQTNTILHNIGNVLSSVVVSSGLLRQKIDESQLWKLKMAHQLLSEHSQDLPGFFRHDPRGGKLIPYMLAVGERLEHEYQQLTHELRDLDTKLQLIQSMVHLRPAAKALRKAPDYHSLNHLIGAALQILQGELQNASIVVVQHIPGEMEVFVPKNRTIHVFINLIKNALDAMVQASTRILTIECEDEEDVAKIWIRDTGKGFDSETQAHLGKLGYTTKLNGQGIGLDFCKRTLSEMGGSLHLESEGIGMGCTVSLTLPKGGVRIKL